MKPQARLSSLPELYAASKPPLTEPAPTAVTMSPNTAGTLGVGVIFVNLISPPGPMTVRLTSSSFAAYASACGPIVAEPLKLRNLISMASADPGRASVQASNAATDARVKSWNLTMSTPPRASQRERRVDCSRLENTGGAYHAASKRRWRSLGAPSPHVANRARVPTLCVLVAVGAARYRPGEVGAH